MRAFIDTLGMVRGGSQRRQNERAKWTLETIDQHVATDLVPAEPAKCLGHSLAEKLRTHSGSVCE
jgi:hypothetical protein